MGRDFQFLKEPTSDEIIDLDLTRSKKSAAVFTDFDTVEKYCMTTNNSL
jgi:hypothetical protein